MVRSYSVIIKVTKYQTVLVPKLQKISSMRDTSTTVNFVSPYDFFDFDTLFGTYLPPLAQILGHSAVPSRAKAPCDAPGILETNPSSFHHRRIFGTNTG